MSTDDKNPKFIFSTTASELLGKAVKGEIDLIRLASEELRNRGQDQDGTWVGFGRAEELHQERMSKE